MFKQKLFILLILLIFMAKEFQVYKLSIENGDSYAYRKKVYELVNEVSRDSYIVLCYDELTQDLTSETLMGLARIDSRTKEAVWKKILTLDSIKEIDATKNEINTLRPVQFIKGLKKVIEEYDEIENKDKPIPIFVSDEANFKKCLEFLLTNGIKCEIMNK